mmetsp:Transcript_14133/g.41960  ORF Transcript_14133/g.41960 Transcript_14133/m.41960 type:complete len:324 (-) Transcript_14133:1048-2019(-)
MGCGASVNTAAPPQTQEQSEESRLALSARLSALPREVEAARARAVELSKPEAEARRAAAPYFDYDALVESVKSGAVAPLRGSYLIKLRARGGRLKRRQDLPPEAFWTAAALREVIRAATVAFAEVSPYWDEESFGEWEPLEHRDPALGWLFVALSYRWLAKGEPDPDGFHLKRVCDFLDLYVGEKRGVTSPLREELFYKIGSLDTPLDCAVFWDFGSLFQGSDRTDEMKVLFGKGLKASNVWYGHMHALTLVQPALPKGFEALCKAEERPCTTYADSGWCYVEASLSSVLKTSVRRIDIEKLSAKKGSMSHGGLSPVANPATA